MLRSYQQKEETWESGNGEAFGGGEENQYSKRKKHNKVWELGNFWPWVSDGWKEGDDENYDWPQFWPGPNNHCFLPFSVVCGIKLWKHGQSCVHWDVKSSILSFGQSRLTFLLMSDTEKGSFLNYADKKTSGSMLLLKAVDDKAWKGSKVKITNTLLSGKCS